MRLMIRIIVVIVTVIVAIMARYIAWSPYTLEDVQETQQKL